VASWPARLIEYLERDGRQALADYLPRQRWFGAKGRQMVGMRLLDHAVLAETPPTVLTIVAIEFQEGPAERYFVPLLMMPQAEAGDVSAQDRLFILSDSSSTEHMCVMDATADADVCRNLWTESETDFYGRDVLGHFNVYGPSRQVPPSPSHCDRRSDCPANRVIPLLSSIGG